MGRCVAARLAPDPGEGGPAGIGLRCIPANLGRELQSYGLRGFNNEAPVFLSTCFSLSPPILLAGRESSVLHNGRAAASRSV